MSQFKNSPVNQQFFEQMFQELPQGVVVYDSELKMICANKCICTMFGVNEEDMKGSTLREIVPGIEENPRYKEYQNTLHSGIPCKVFFSRTMVEDERFYCSDAMKIDECLVLFISDITNVKEKEKKQKKIEEEMSTELDALLAGIHSPVFFKDLDSKYTSVNQVCADFYGVSTEDMIGKSIADFASMEEADIVLQADRDVLSGKENNKPLEHLCFDANGILHWFLTTIVSIKNSKGQITGLVGISFNITERKITETELDLLATALHQTTEAVVITDVDAKIQYVNPAFEVISGYSAESVLGKTPAILKGDQVEKEFYINMWKQLLNGQSWSGHFINKRKDGTLFEEDAVISPVFDVDGVITNYVGVKRNVTKEVALEVQLRQSQKMEAIGRLAGGVAHDFNNILTAILGHAELILLTMNESNRLYKKIFAIQQAGLKAAELTQQMLAFSRKQVIERDLLNINDVIKDSLVMLKYLLGKEVQLELSLSDNLDSVMSNVTQIEQIIMNLTVNAKDAISHVDGVVKITTSNIFLNEEKHDYNFIVPPGPYAKIIIEDNGCGIPQGSIKHIFEPFFTKKLEAVGTGLGLSTVYGIVKQHNGCIFVKSEEGAGTVFEILLPSAPSSIGTEDETSCGENFHIRAGTIFLVEDESLVLGIEESILQAMGYSVITATSAEDAIEIFAKDDLNVDLLITDLGLPVMNGVELARELRKNNPQLKVLFMSGSLLEDNPAIDFNIVKNKFIEKPFSLDKFASLVRDFINLKG